MHVSVTRFGKCHEKGDAGAGMPAATMFGKRKRMDGFVREDVGVEAKGVDGVGQLAVLGRGRDDVGAPVCRDDLSSAEAVVVKCRTQRQDVSIPWWGSTPGLG